MPTARVNLTASWQLLVADGVDFIIDNQSSMNAQITFQTSAPSADAPYHTLAAGEGLIRMGIKGSVYGRDLEGAANAFLIVSA